MSPFCGISKIRLTSKCSKLLRSLYLSWSLLDGCRSTANSYQYTIHIVSRAGRELTLFFANFEVGYFSVLISPSINITPFLDNCALCLSASRQYIDPVCIFHQSHYSYHSSLLRDGRSNYLEGVMYVPLLLAIVELLILC